MRTTRLLAIAAALFTSVAVPASAAWDRIGSVGFSFRPEHETQYGNFGGRVDALSLRARNGTVVCNDVSATFMNGRTRTIYRGTLPAGRNVTLDLPGAGRRIERIDFQCRSMTFRPTRVDIAADIGRYRAEWRRSPAFSWMFDRDNDRYAYDRDYDDNRPYRGPY